MQRNVGVWSAVFVKTASLQQHLRLILLVRAHVRGTRAARGERGAVVRIAEDCSTMCVTFTAAVQALLLAVSIAR